jgi:hypothetical protein
LSSQDVLSVLSQGNEVLEISETFFSTIHTWFPIISKKRINLGMSLRNAGPDIAMLFTAMKLIISQPGSNMIVDSSSDSLYRLAKNFLQLLEANGCLSLPCLQAMILIALYEYSHAIYPAAWMTIGACSRYADILGISPGKEVIGVMDQWVRRSV